MGFNNKKDEDAGKDGANIWLMKKVQTKRWKSQTNLQAI